MSAERVVYLDASAIVKLVVAEPESAALQRHLRRKTAVTSALSRTEVARAVLPFGAPAAKRANDVLAAIGVIRLNDRILKAAGALVPAELRSLDAIHLATAQRLGPDLRQVITYDERMADAAGRLGMEVAAPT